MIITIQFVACVDSLYLCTVAQVPYLPSSKAQTLNIMTLLEGRAGRLVDLGSGDGRVVSGLQLLQGKKTPKHSYVIKI